MRRRATKRSSAGGASRSTATLQPRVKRHQLLKQHFFTSGEHYWEVHVRRMRACDHGASAVVIGVAASEGFEGESLDGNPLASSWSRGAFGYAASGAIVKNGVAIGRVEPYKEGDTVGVLLDMNSQSVALFLNGDEQRVVAESPWTNESREDDLDEERKHERASTTPPEASGFHFHSVFPALTYSAETDELDFSMRHSVPKCIRRAQ